MGFTFQRAWANQLGRNTQGRPQRNIAAQLFLPMLLSSAAKGLWAVDSKSDLGPRTSDASYMSDFGQHALTPLRLLLVSSSQNKDDDFIHFTEFMWD